MKSKKNELKEIQEEKHFYIDRYMSYAEASEELSYLKVAYDDITARWENRLNNSKKMYLKNLETKMKILTKIVNHE